jgi:hypothetical protein
MYKKISVYVAVLWLLLTVTACSTKDDLEAFRKAEYSLKSVDQVNVNGINLLEKKGTQDFTFSEAAVLFSAFSENQLNATSTLNLNVELGNEHKNRTMKLTQLKWQMLVDDQKALSGVVNEAIQLKNGLNTITVSSPLALDQERGGDSLSGLLQMVTLLNQKKGKVKLQIKPTIQTSVGPIELPTYINVM